MTAGGIIRGRRPPGARRSVRERGRWAGALLLVAATDVLLWWAVVEPLLSRP